MRSYDVRVPHFEKLLNRKSYTSNPARRLPAFQLSSQHHLLHLLHVWHLCLIFPARDTTSSQHAKPFALIPCTWKTRSKQCMINELLQGLRALEPGAWNFSSSGSPEKDRSIRYTQNSNPHKMTPAIGGG